VSSGCLTRLFCAVHHMPNSRFPAWLPISGASW
jgi:hypothetical protein